MKKAIIFDVDGTAMPIGDGNWPTERLKAAIARLQPEYHISTATGRSGKDATEVIKFLGLTDSCIIASGTEIYNPLEEKVVWREAIPISTYDHIRQALKNCDSAIWSGDYHEHDQVAHSPDLILSGSVSVIYIIAVEDLEADRVVELLQHPDLTIINMHSYWDQSKRDIHIHSVKASKEHAVAELLKREGIKKEDSIVIGDGLNDTHLFAAGGLKVAMGNAQAELKERADLVIGDVADDGLAEYLESLT